MAGRKAAAKPTAAAVEELYEREDDEELDDVENSGDSSSSTEDDGQPDTTSSPSSIDADADADDEADTRSVTSWYSPARRRAGEGTKRRNKLLSRHVELPYVRDDTSTSSKYSTTGSPEGEDGSILSGCDTSFRETSALDQLFAVIDRSTKQLLGRKVMLALDILVPIIFVLITVLLWGLFKTEIIPEGNYLQDDGRYVFFQPTAYSALLCYDSDKVNLSSFLSNCSYTNTPVDDEHCSGDYRYVPLPENSLCIMDPTFSFAAVALVYYRNSMGNLTYIPHLDDLVILQWIALLGYRENKVLIDAAISGLAENNRFSAGIASGKLLLVGTGAEIDQLGDYIIKTSELAPYYFDKSRIYSTYAGAKQIIDSGERVWMVIEAKSMTSSQFDVLLHVNNSALPFFGVTVNPAFPGGFQFDTAEMYYASGFSTIQKMVSTFYLNEIMKADIQVDHFIATMNTAPFQRIPILVQARRVLPLILTFAYLYAVTQLCRKIVSEREKRLREAMLIMGLKQWTLYVTDFLIQLVLLFLVAILSAIILKVTYVTKSDVMVMFLLYILFSLTTIPLAGIIATFFDKARLATLVAPVVYFILVVPTFAMANAKGAVVVGFSILSPSGFASALNILLNHETGGGLTADHFNDHADNPTLTVVVVMLAADFVIYYLIMLYLDAVMPREWGTPKHPLFFILDPVRWCCGGKEKRLGGGPDGRAENGVFEDDAYEHDVVQMAGLRKLYKRGGKSFVAVDNFYWGMREGEISVLLGHNGAGKTTVLNMMTGMIEPDEGDCYVYGLSVRQECDMVRREAGFCPQHNILWPELSCREHLEFFGKIKGLKGWELEDAMCRMLHETDLLEKMDQPARSLSGGQKRKLSIAIAFVGDSRLVFLDEPTAGLDVSARRHTWELLRRMAQSRTIILTTHYMDEADLLGHRIGIMSQGRLKCSGSSMFLKARLGVGYSITISVDPEIDTETIDDLVLDNVTNSDVLGHNGCELTYRLPTQSVPEFPVLLNLIEECGEDMGVRGYSLAATTLEEVFLKVSEEDLPGRVGADVSEEEDAMQIIWNNTFMDGRLWSQFKAMLVKRFWNSIRDRRMQCFQIVCPVLCILVAMLLNLVKFSHPQYLAYDYSMFGTDQPTPSVFTAQCDDYWGKNPHIDGAIANETHYYDAVNLSYYLLDTWYWHPEPRYGAITCDDRTLFRSVAYSGFKTSVVLLYNTSSIHQGGLNMATYYDQFLKYFSNGTHTGMKWAAELFEKTTNTDAITFIFVGALIMIPFTFLPSNPVAWIVKERECGSRHQQNIAGLNFFIYWISNFLFDVAAYFVSMILCIIIFAIFNRREFIAPDRVGGTFVLLIVFGFTSTVAAYVLSFLFNEHATAQTVVMAASFVLGFLLLMIVYVLNLQDTTRDTSDNLRWVFRIVPTYCIGEGITNMLMLDANIMVGNAVSVWDMDQLGWSLVYLAAEFPVFCILTLIIDNPWRRKLFGKMSYKRDAPPDIPPDEDSDVEDERLAVYEAAGQTDSSDVIRVMDLRKVYDNGNVAVKGITFSIFPGEVFGFLGTNGAGKTTALSMLCQMFLPTSGCASVCGYDLVNESGEAFQCIGYCPQFDATLDLLSVEEHINLFTALRGIAYDERDAVLEALLQLCELTTYRKTLASRLSGGNRRKLSVAMSLVGGPQVVLMDEPSAGMDPVARRGMWTAIQRASKHCSIVLTTHHLEEVEALADIVSIMVDGTLRCIGDKIHLKNKYGTGFELSLRVAGAEFKEVVEQFIEEEFAGATMNESDERRLVYQLPHECTFGDIFEVVQANKKRLRITDYSVSQVSIEQIFLRISGEDF